MKRKARRSPSARQFVLPVLLVLGACSSESALCQSIGDLESNVQALRDVNVVDDGIDALTTQVDAVSTSFDEVKQEAGDTFSSDVDAVETAVSGVEGIIQQVQAGTSIADLLAPAQTAITTLVSSIESLVSTVQEQECG